MNKKLLLSLAVVSTLGLTGLAGCNSSSTGPTEDTSSPTVSVDPISDIEIVKPTEDILVGEIIDLDTYVTVVGGSDPKGYTVTVRPASREVVSVEGHTLTVLKEGPINLIVEAGDETAIISWEAISSIKSQYKKATSGIDKNFALIDVGFNSSHQLVLTGEGCVHNKNYFYSYGYDQGGNPTGEGMILLGDGNIYDFTGTEYTCEGFEVIPGPEAGYMWDYYFVNMGFTPTYDCAATVTETLEDGSEYSYLCIDSSVPAPSGMEEYAHNMADWVLLTLWGYSLQLQSDSFKANWDLDSIAVLIENVGKETPLYSLMVTCDGSANGAYAGKSTYFAWSLLSAEPEDYQIPVIEQYLEAGTTPDPIAITEVASFASAISTATSYTMTSVYQSISTEDNKTILTEGKVMAGTTVTHVDAVNKIVSNTYTNGSYSEQFGYAEKDGTVYFYQSSEDDPSTFAVEAVSGVTFDQILAAVGASSWASVGTTGLVASKRQEAETAVAIALTDQSDTCAFVTNLIATVPLYGKTCADNLFDEETGKHYGKNADMVWKVTNDLSSAIVTIDVPINFGAFVPKFIIQYSELNTTDATADIAGVTFPTVA